MISPQQARTHSRCRIAQYTFFVSSCTAIRTMVLPRRSELEPLAGNHD
jgi:hypothetical protein